MDKTRLYQKMMPDKSLATEQLARVKKEKKRISLAIIANRDKSKGPLIQAIRTAKNLQCFKRIRVKNLEIKQRHNKKAWMTTAIMEEWLRWFWQYIQKKKGSKKVLLLIDNHSAYVAAVENLKASSNSIFSLIKVCFLPPNTTSLY